MKKVLQLRGKGKVRKAKAVEVKDLGEYRAMDLDSKMALIRELIPIRAGDMEGNSCKRKGIDSLEARNL